MFGVKGGLYQLFTIAVIVWEAAVVPDFDFLGHTQGWGRNSGVHSALTLHHHFTPTLTLPLKGEGIFVCPSFLTPSRGRGFLPYPFK